MYIYIQILACKIMHGFPLGGSTRRAPEVLGQHTPGLHNKIPAHKISPGSGLLRNRFCHW